MQTQFDLGCCDRHARACDIKERNKLENHKNNLQPVLTLMEVTEISYTEQ